MKGDAFNEFIVIARCLSLTKAAEELHTTEPTLSKHMKQLECMLQVSLFQRGRHLALTPAGDYFLRHLNDIYKDYRELIDSCRETAAKSSSHGTIEPVSEETLLSIGA